MLNKSFKTYKKSKTIRFTFGDLILITILVCLAILWLNGEFRNSYSEQIEEFFRILGFALLAVLIFTFIRSHSKKERINGEFTGPLELFSDKIIIGERTILLPEINNIRAEINDFDEKKLFILYMTPYPKISNGYNNILEIDLIGKEKIIIHFQQKYENEFSRINKDLLIEYYKKSKISFLNLIDILEINDYEEIQKFKKTIANNV